MEDKYVAMFILHCLGDTLGFKNGDWEFNGRINTSEDKYVPLGIMEFVNEFIDLGGVNGISLENWNASDDTIYNLKIAQALLEYNGNIDDNIILQKRALVLGNNQIKTDNIKRGINRFPGISMEKYIGLFTETKDARVFDFDLTSGGNGSAMRSLSIGLAFHKKEDIDKLINMAINSSKLTHNCPIGYLAGLTSAYFVHLAINNIDINSWVFRLLDILESDDVKKYVNFKNTDEALDYLNYIHLWKKYIELRFGNTEKPLKSRLQKNLNYRAKFYYENFSDGNMIGGSGLSAMIMCYDVLVDCDGLWEKVIFYGILHPGDSDTVGAIVGGLYGVLYGFGDVPESMLKYLEFKDELHDMGEKFYSKFVNDVQIQINDSLKNKKYIIEE